MSLHSCFQRARKMGVLTDLEEKELRRRYQGMIDDGLSNPEARDRMAKQIKAEADLRERAALLTHIRVDTMLRELETWRDHMGRKDMGQAYVNLHENMGDAGSFIQDAQGRYQAIFAEAQAEMKDIMREFRRGAFTGDLRRERKSVRMRMDNLYREIHGVDTGDAKAKAMAQAWLQVIEKLRVRFNEAGGNIGKLEGGYVPQSHDPFALLTFKHGSHESGRMAWVAYMMEPGRLDRARMKDEATGLPLTDSELRQALEVSWERITTNGYFDAEINGQPQGRGALYTQHAEHRFIHFATPDKAMEYAKSYGSKGGDLYAAMMGHLNVMSRDIAHMEVFGPNPNRTREFIKQHLISMASKTKANDVVIAEQTAELKRLAAAMNRLDETYEQLLDRHAEILRDIDRMRASSDHRAYIANQQMFPDRMGQKAQRYQTTYTNAIQELQAVQEQINAYERGEKPTTVSAAAAEAEFQYLLEHMREPISVSSRTPGTDRALAWVNNRIRFADAMWENMRGGPVGDPKMAARWQSARNFMSSAALGSAVVSSLTDPAFGQDMRLRMGQSMVKSNFARIMILNLREMITMGSREDAIAAGLGIDAAQRVLHRHAKEVSGWDHRFWSAYVADRVLTTGLLLPWTQAGKTVFGVDTMRFFADLSGTAWKDLPDATRRQMTMNGFGEREWMLLRTVPKHEGVLLRPTEVIQYDRTIGERYLQMILRLQKHAIPEATVASQSVMQIGQAGTLGGEVARSMMQFKGFAFGVGMLHILRIARELQDPNYRWTAAGYAATLFITSTFLGMVAIALKDLKDQKEPRKWLDEKTWLDPAFVGEAILQAGGLGILGDFIRASDNRLGGGLAGTLAGPIAGKVDNLIDIGMAGFRQATRTAKPNAPTPEEEAVRFLRSGAVPGSNHWAVAAIYQRAIMDRLQRLVDPDAQKAFNRQVQKQRSDYGRGYYWRPGDTSPRWMQ